jgi:hypothetical protein
MSDFDNPKRPSGDEAFDIGDLIRYRSGGATTYEYEGVLGTDAAWHILRDHADGRLYKTSADGITDYDHVPPRPGEVWAFRLFDGSLTRAHVKGVFEDDGTTYITYRVERAHPGTEAFYLTRPVGSFREAFNIRVNDEEGS